MSLLVDNPIINSPFEEPTKYWDYREGQPVLVEGRRPAGFYLRPRTRGPQVSLFEEEFVPLELVNNIRERIKEWRKKGYPGVTSITRRLLDHWNNPERERKLFFCQLESAETIIWLVEASPAEKQGINITKDETNNPLSLSKGYKALTRYATKMATGSGKTVVMGMLIAWSVLNKLANPQDKRFSDAVLIVCPNITIRERLKVLLPWRSKNYYDRFDLVSHSFLERLQQGKFEITNWHLFQPKDDSRSRSVRQRGPESDNAFCRRVLEKLGNKQNILVINDEAHHAYRPRQPISPEELGKLSREERERIKEEFEAATVWIQGLDRFNQIRSLNLVLDFTATPFYIKGTGYEEGAPFPWIISDFSLVDAIECGIVKIPRIPVDDNTGALIPKYFRLWEWINKRLPLSQRQTARRRAKPEAVLREAEGALTTLASEWKRTFEAFRDADSPVPPVLIVVCDNTDLSNLVHEHIAKGSALFELKNQDEQSEVTFRIDTKLLAEAESAIEGETKKEAAERLRKVVDTIGKTEWEGEGDPPGKNIRSIISVAMLNEGWDAQNVTQILGLRAFTSQLLCEQVVGRGLRRLNYDELPGEPEYVDIYGVPFEVIPVKKKPISRPGEQKISTLVRALPERKHLEIKFPRVEGFVFDVHQRIRLNLEDVPYLMVDPSTEPTEVVAKPVAG
ncbi:MAG: DEAD/DEAH box helicase, partial [Candidatus Lokiarchaeia archaeon]